MFKNAVLIIGLSLTSSQCYADKSTNEEMMLSMIEYITQNDKHVYNGEKLPTVELQTVDQLCQLVYTPETYKEVMEIGSCGVMGAYDNDRNIIFISNEILEPMVEEGFFETILFHETVHFLQYLDQNEGRFGCMAEKEKNAYTLQDKYIDYMGFPEEQKPDKLFMMFLECDEVFE